MATSGERVCGGGSGCLLDRVETDPDLVAAAEFNHALENVERLQGVGVCRRQRVAYPELVAGSETISMTKTCLIGSPLNDPGDPTSQLVGMVIAIHERAPHPRHQGRQPTDHPPAQPQHSQRHSQRPVGQPPSHRRREAVDHPPPTHSNQYDGQHVAHHREHVRQRPKHEPSGRQHRQPSAWPGLAG